MKTIFALVAVAVAASLIGAIPVLHSSFATPSANDNQPAANPNSTQAQDVQDNNSGGNNDNETNDAISGQVANVDQGMDGESADVGNSGSDDAETNDDGNSAVNNHSDGEQADDAAKP